MLTWIPSIRNFTGNLLIGISLVGIAIFTPMDNIIFNEEYAFKDLRDKWSYLIIPFNILLIMGGYSHKKGLDFKG